MRLWKKLGKLCYFIKELMKRLSNVRKGLIFATSSVLEIVDELILARNENRLPNLRKVIGHTVNFVTLLGRVHKQTAAERKERLKPALKKIQIQNIFLERICLKA